ncbi:TPA: hypothetical protein HA318_04750 [Candidatus Micrarchaeota archaeon]|nr:MAG: hypothetical protein AUJ65_06015 [Candidatus Micrarchaeota archaeon CG1_02_51_15]HII39281.1 hypothetical protein [Candidatus Micrarchaeota archaeon]
MAWETFADFLKDHRILDLDAAGVMVAGFYTNPPGPHNERQVKIKHEIAGKRSVSMKVPNYAVKDGCLPAFREQLHRRGVYVFLPKGLSRPHSEE